MENRAKIFGHPIHPILIAFPIAFLSGAVVADIVRHLSRDPAWGMFAFWLLAGGIATGIIAGIFGLIDWSALPHGSKARHTGTSHAIANLCGLALFGVSLAIRWRDPASPGLTETFIGIAGLLTLGIGGWLGGELVFKHRVGVHEKRI